MTHYTSDYLAVANISVPNSALGTSITYQVQPFTQRQFNFLDTWTWTRGVHGLKFGADFKRLFPIYSSLGKAASFLNLDTLENFQQGNLDTLYVEAGSDVLPIFYNLSLYAEDHWKVGKRLSLDYGLRWEFNPPPGFSGQVYPLAVTSSDPALMGIAPKGTPLYSTIYHDFAPRLGFAWQITTSKRHPVVVRGGTGIFFDTGQAVAGNALATNPEFFNFTEYSNVPLPVPNSFFVLPPVDNSLEFGPPYSLSGIVDPNLKMPYTEQWNLSLDLGLTSRNTLTANYVGNAGKKLLFVAQYYNGINATFGNYSAITSNASSSSYNALQLQDRGYITKGLQGIASYTWAHSIDNVSTDNFNPTLPLRGNSDYDLRQVFNIALNYEIPGGSGNKLNRALTTGWMFSNRFAAQTGYPADVLQGDYTAGNGTLVYIRPDLVSGVPLYLHNVPDVPGGWELNRAAFNPVPLNPDGTPVHAGSVGRNGVYGPAFWVLNTAFQRDFPIMETLRMSFRAEAFNILNHPNFGNIQAIMPFADFGQATSVARIGVANSLYGTGSPRSIQLMLRLHF